MANKRLLGGSAPAARRVWDDEHLSNEVLSFCGPAKLVALRSVSRRGKAAAGTDALWGRHVCALPCARGLLAAGYLAENFASFVKMKRAMARPTGDSFTVARIEHDKYALAFEIRDAGDEATDPVVLSTVCDFVTSTAFPEGERRTWAEEMGDSGCDFLHLDDEARQTIEALELPSKQEIDHTFHARLIRKHDGKIIALLQTGRVRPTLRVQSNEDDSADSVDVISSTHNALKGWFFGVLSLEFRYVEEPTVENPPVLGLSLLKMRMHGVKHDYEVLPDDLFP
eukprot:CAMPEP_0119270174 /NCGR_PEP_ID=MMETSP1329-20130426/7285_1 /TAXON_ID=114041 /ORGANISM="Genus nov. species nov., Strain RCC1024" /LENGTH=282 /DNA_ID=CAMNT_0007270183 /DNA_START=80 /DNA_END=928 /DNA_ORIENTATION=-